MKEIGAFEAKNKFGALLDWVEGGEEVVITRHGKAVARLVSVQEKFDRTKARQAAANITVRRKGMSLGELEIKDLINEGRP
ncbi:type II toxin-antitoxin system prevent-host-death family antitoxin [Nitrosomonas sp.]|uniref:type II toxin-antitoxin system Phd/YefM family antitoxin n=1 Tax=Nitrosomonas sp. TaxID=42353 RepID=UPI00283F615F|nr:type II toxin-antitoxin system prevent-host-death family antitoxin [Nitrosomonas sp.]MDR4515695.1 type II toxin-antitoxin system prevent-host-death family antitoxin [Nitrosomonas sp.]